MKENYTYLPTTFGAVTLIQMVIGISCSFMHRVYLSTDSKYCPLQNTNSVLKFNPNCNSSIIILCLHVYVFSFYFFTIFLVLFCIDVLIVTVVIGALQNDD